MKKVMITLLAMVLIALGSTRVYEVEPFKNCNGWVAGTPRYGIGQTFVATCDSFLWADFFVGSPNDTGYIVEINNYQSGSRIFYGYAEGKKGYDYTRANLRRWSSEPIIKGKEYELRITNVRGESINYYYDPNNPYRYGKIKIGSGEEITSSDLAARIEGENRDGENY